MKVNGEGNNGYGVSYTVKDGPPRYGTVVAGSTPGSFVYTANDALIQPGIVDHFTITVNNGTAAKLPGIAGMIQGMLHSFAIMVGAAKPDTFDKEIWVTVDGTGQYGNAAAAADYWVNQSYSNCQLQAAASAVLQATKTLPTSTTEQTWVDWAKTTDSVKTPGAKMYLDANIEEGVATEDAVALINEHFDVTATYREYDKTQEAGEEALRDLQAALAEGKATMVAYPVSIVWTAVTDFKPTPKDSYFVADHAAVVTQVDLKKRAGVRQRQLDDEREPERGGAGQGAADRRIHERVAGRRLRPDDHHPPERPPGRRLARPGRTDIPRRTPSHRCRRRYADRRVL